MEKRLVKNKKVLMLTVRLQMGFGVAVVINELARRTAGSVEIVAGALEIDDYFADQLDTAKVPAEPAAIAAFCRENAIDLVVAHSSPYFEAIADMEPGVERWAWEHGDPTPELFVSDVEQRKQIALHKQRHVYPKVDKVIAISEFVRQDIRWPFAKVIYNGSDHVRPASPRQNVDGLLRVGTLSRMGAGESFYKGGEMFVDLARRFVDDPNRVSFEIMGRGTEQDAKAFADAGVRVHLNATDDERSRFLQELDIFVSLSLWEGFNLPLVEAQASGSLGLALDVGAHPEVTPFVFGSVEEMETFIRRLDGNRQLLFDDALAGHRACLERFRWDEAARAFTEELG